MKEDAIKTIGIEDFQTYTNAIDYVDDDFVVINSLENTPYSNQTIRLGCFIAFYCVEGYVQLDMNHKTYQLKENDVIICLPNSIISNTLISPTYKIRILGLSTCFLQNAIKIEKDTWNLAMHIHNNPVKHANEKEALPFNLYKDLIMIKTKEGPHRYSKDIMQHLYSALFCEIMAEINKQIEETGETLKESKNAIKQADHIMRQFMIKLSADNGMHRSVSYYADELCYTPKHFSKMIKDACGKTPLELINEQAIGHIKHKLKHSDKTIKEIADEFNFSNLSFFGKYVKKHLGLSPQNYRNRHEE